MRENEKRMYPYGRLNTSKRVIRSRELSLATLEEIRAELEKKEVKNYKRITTRQGREEIQTNTDILTSNQSKLPKEVKNRIFSSGGWNNTYRHL